MTINLSYIDDCHWLKSNRSKKVIIKFTRRKDANHIQKNKKKLKGMNLCSTCVNNPVFINDSVCSYYKVLWQKCKKRRSNKFIRAFRVSSGTLRLKLTASGQDLDELFPKNELLRTSDKSLVCLSCLFSFEFMITCIYFLVSVFLSSYF